MNLYLFLILLLELFVVSFIDVRVKKISNLWSIAHILIFAGMSIYAGTLPEITHFIFPLGMIVTGFVLFVFHIMGAGDSKYLASLFLLIPTLLIYENILQCNHISLHTADLTDVGNLS